ESPAATAELPLKLLALWPKFLSYLISFVILGVYWVGHHIQLSFIRQVDRPLLWINILFLLWVALVPFFTALLSEYSKAILYILPGRIDIHWGAHRSSKPTDRDEIK